jgi:hypothetical protein
MATKNNITNDSLISKPFSSAYADGWGKIYLKTPKEWCAICGQNPQNLDFPEGQFWETPITRKQFEKLFETNENQNDN